MQSRRRCEEPQLPFPWPSDGAAESPASYYRRMYVREGRGAWDLSRLASKMSQKEGDEVS